MSSEARRRRTIDELVELLVALSERDPLVLLVEDLHWCDPSSLELLGRVAERIVTERVLLVTTSRPEFVPAWATLDHVHGVSLDRVTEHEAADLVNAILAGSVFVESVFSWPGMGKAMLAAINARDYPMVMGAASVYAGVVILANMTADLALPRVDPRRRE